jgi:hypothetical protein
MFKLKELRTLFNILLDIYLFSILVTGLFLPVRPELIEYSISIVFPIAIIYSFFSFWIKLNKKTTQAKLHLTTANTFTIGIFIFIIFTKMMFLGFGHYDILTDKITYGNDYDIFYARLDAAVSVISIQYLLGFALYYLILIKMRKMIIVTNNQLIYNAVSQYAPLVLFADECDEVEIENDLEAEQTTIDKARQTFFRESEILNITRQSEMALIHKMEFDPPHN